MEGLPLDTDMYKYTALEPKSSFRLLKLLKGSSPEIKCELYPSLLQEGHPRYEALSYTWGSNEVVECIRLNRKLFWVANNLHSVLQGLRWHDRDRILWIDAICINQGDKVERSQQVQQMGQIYEQAEKVLIWLGKATPQIIALIESLNQYRNICSDSRNMQEVLKDWPCENHSIGIQQLLNREWFTRVWIIQEAARAHRADVYCGVRSIPAEMLALASSLTKRGPPPHCKPILNIMAESLRKSSWWAEARDLRILLQKFHASKATDERDKIYALIGMSSDPADIESLTIDYRRPTSQVAHEAITHLLRSRLDSQSRPLSVYEVLNLLISFRTLDVTYFVPATSREDRSEVIFPSIQSGYVLSESSRPRDLSQGIATPRNPALFLFEERPVAGLENQKTCYSQVVELMLDQLSSRAPLDGDYGDEFQIYPWGSMENHVKVVVIHDKKDAILKALARGFDQVARQVRNLKVGIRDEEECEAEVLQAVVEKGDVEAMRSLLVDVGVNVNAQGGHFGNALQAAICHRKWQIVEFLLNTGADANARIRAYGSPLQIAIRYGVSGQIVKMLLDAGADVNPEDEEYGNALQAAVCYFRYGSSDVVKMLLNAGANVNAQGGEHGTALQAAYWLLETWDEALDGELDWEYDWRGGIIVRVGPPFMHDMKQTINMMLDAGADGGRVERSKVVDECKV